MTENPISKLTKIEEKIRMEELDDGIFLLKGKTSMFGFDCSLPTKFRDYMGKCFLSGLSSKEQVLFPRVISGFHEDKQEYDLLPVNMAWKEFRENEKFRNILQNYSIVAKEVVDPAFRTVFPEPVVIVKDDDILEYRNKKVNQAKANINVLEMLSNIRLFEKDSVGGFTYKGKNIETGDWRDWENYDRKGFSNKGYAISCKGEGNCFVINPIDPDYANSETIVAYKKR